MSRVEFDTDQNQSSSVRQSRSYRSSPVVDPKKRRTQIIMIAIALAATALVLFYGALQRPSVPSRASYPYEQPPKPVSL